MGSRGSLGLSGGSPSQLLGSFLAKTLCLCFVVFLATGVELPRLVMEIVYGGISIPKSGHSAVIDSSYIGL